MYHSDYSDLGSFGAFQGTKWTHRVKTTPKKQKKFKNAFFSKAPNSRILKLGILNCFTHISATALTDLVANFFELGHVETCGDLH